MSFGKKLTRLRSKYYLGPGIFISALIIFTQWSSLLSGRTYQFVGMGILMTIVWTLISLFNILAYPWVRMNLCGDVDHPFHHVTHIVHTTGYYAAAAQDAYNQAPTMVTWERIYDSFGYLVRNHLYSSNYYKRQARDRTWSNIYVSIIMRMIIIVFKYFLDCFIWLISPLLIWISLGNRTLNIAYANGYLKNQL